MSRIDMLGDDNGAPEGAPYIMDPITIRGSRIGEIIFLLVLVGGTYLYVKSTTGKRRRRA